MTGGTRAPVVIAGGGTAGHVLPALAVAHALVGRGRDPSTIRFVGSARGLEARLVPEAGFPLTLLPGRGVVRRASWNALTAIAGIGAATVRALWLIARWRPAAILSVGGYAAVPCAVAALVWRVPLVVAESNAVPGATNRISARWARAAAVAFDGTGLPRARVTGNPVRAEVLAVRRGPAGRAAARRELGVPDGRRLIAVTGGSLGARRVNDAVIDLATRWAGREDVAIYHAIGSRDWPELAARLPGPSSGGLPGPSSGGLPGPSSGGLPGPSSGALSGDTGAGLWYRGVEYTDQVPLLLAAADLWIGRAGGTTIAELTAVGMPSILVPLPIAPHDHQAVGARFLAATGACRVVLDRDCTGARLAEEVGALIDTPGALEAMAAAAAAHGHPNAADNVAALLESASESRGG